MRDTPNRKCLRCAHSQCVCSPPPTAEQSPTRPVTPTTPASSQATQDTLVEGFTMLNVDNDPDDNVTDRDVLAQNEVAEDGALPSEPPLEGGEAREYYLVTHGLTVGLFRHWDVAAPEVIGYPANVHKKYDNWSTAVGLWVTACMTGKVVRPLHPQSLLPMVVSRAEVNRRIAFERQRRRHQRRQARRHLAGATAASSPASPPTSAAGLQRANAVADLAQLSSPSPSSSANVDEKHIKSEVAEASVVSTSFARPGAWVVLRGIQPGVYTVRDEYLRARGVHPRAWVIPCATEEEAEGVFAQYLGFMEFLEPQ